MHLVELLGVVQKSRQTARPHVRTNALDYANRRQRLAKHFLGQFPTPRGNHFSLGSELRAQIPELLVRAAISTNDALYSQVRHVKALEVRLSGQRSNSSSQIQSLLPLTCFPSTKCKKV